ncbi:MULTISPECIES: type II secretion system protein GspE [Xenorhabdus]|uniref:type II secretion system protein GspE n=1 Tax=Xenorhabdus TaxID=626 RepID=UPI0006464BB8|nr:MULTISPECIES: type II secretion system protein GspE [Xenorhabdus]
MKNTENILIERKIKELCQKHQAIIIKRDAYTITIACSQSPNEEFIASLRFISGAIIDFDIWPKAKIESMLTQEGPFIPCTESYCAENDETKTYRREKLSTPNNNHNDTQFNDSYTEDIDTPVIQLINQTISISIQKRASDIHFEPSQYNYRIRIRVDGVLHSMSSPSSQMNAGIPARLKIMAKLNIAEKRQPQDGQFDWNDHKTSYAIRISTLPTLYGEKIVLRILNTIHQLSLEQLGLSESHLQLLKQKLRVPQGMIVVTGPTGSGKTVTLYSCLKYLNQAKKNICSVEDPVEIPLTGINQTQVNNKIGLDFAKVLRALLRQDPDIIMVGEIRDNETAEISMKAAQTGHLVLSTLHTNSTIDTLSRLQNLGVSGYTTASCVKLIIAQRLVRKLCPHCRQKTEEPTIIHFENREIKQQITVQQWVAVGCEHCFSGYYGRTAIYEFLEIKPELQQTLSEQFSDKFPCLPVRQQQATLFSAGLELVEQGTTTLEEIYQITGQETYPIEIKAESTE